MIPFISQVEKMKEIAKLKAKEERKKLESEVRNMELTSVIFGNLACLYIYFRHLLPPQYESKKEGLTFLLHTKPFVISLLFSF